MARRPQHGGALGPLRWLPRGCAASAALLCGNRWLLKSKTIGKYCFKTVSYALFVHVSTLLSYQRITVVVGDLASKRREKQVLAYKLAKLTK
jgi:hypothetical protein